MLATINYSQTSLLNRWQFLYINGITTINEEIGKVQDRQNTFFLYICIDVFSLIDKPFSLPYYKLCLSLHKGFSVAISLTVACDISNKSLFFSPSDHIFNIMIDFVSQKISI